jgi:GT2 family glycosyltransferase
VLMLAGRLRLPEGELSASAETEHPQNVEARSLSLSKAARRRRGRTSLTLLRFPADRGPRERAAALTLRSGRRRVSLSQSGLEAALQELRTFLREQLAGLDRDAREEIQRFIVAFAVPGLDDPGRFSLGKALHAVREALREPLRERLITKGEPQTLNLELVLELDERSFWLSGWTRDEDGTFTNLSAVSPEGQRVPLDDALRVARRDVEQALGRSPARPTEKQGFIKFFQLPAASPLPEGWILELSDATGAGVEADARETVQDPAEVRERLLVEFGSERPEREEVAARQVRPALTCLQNRLRNSVGIAGVTEYGSVASPELSVVVPLYRRLDFLQHQLLHFSQDPAMLRADLIFVLDSPELAADLAEQAGPLHDLHGVPFRVVTLSDNGGFAIANNLGASLAEGELLVFLNSDVLPVEPGWLEHMRRFYRQTPRIGALGPKLLYEDDSIQHAGMYFERDPASPVWRNQHYFKGLHRSFAEANVTRRVPAVTGACLMIDRALYDELDGFRAIYLKGGYEDSDLCLRLAEAGRENWYQSDVELYHLEAQSYTATERATVTKYNAWLQTQVWAQAIPERMRAHPTERAPESPPPDDVAPPASPVTAGAGPPGDPSSRTP